MIELIRQIDLIDRAIFQFINQTLANPVTDFIMPLVTADLNLKIFYALCLLLILWKGDKRLRVAIIFSIIVVALTDQVVSSLLKPLFARPRPCHDMTVHLLVNCGQGFSLPSSHAANLFGQAFLFYQVKRSYSKYLIPLAILVSLSRVFVGVHYPFDILAGAAIGTLIGFGIGTVFIKAKWPISVFSAASRRKKQESHR